MTEHGARTVFMVDDGEYYGGLARAPRHGSATGAATFVSVETALQSIHRENTKGARGMETDVLQGFSRQNVITRPATTHATSGEREIGTLPCCRLLRVTQYIQEHLDQDLTLAALGAVAHMSPYHFARLFKGSTGVPPHRFVVRKRIDRAIALLASQELSIARISRLAGFRTPSHFATVFRRITGITPRAYRAECLREGRLSGKGEQDGTQ